jgi:YgiT-type zinc finger domain-containing protein
MKCVICSSQDIEKKYVDEEIRVKNDVVMVSINTLVCGSCGERYYDRLTIKTLEEIKEKLSRKTIELDVIGSVLRFRDKSSNVAVS